MLSPSSSQQFQQFSSISQPVISQPVISQPVVSQPVISQPIVKRPSRAKQQYYCLEAKGPMLDRVFSMRYRSYQSAGHIDPCSTGKFMDEYDELPSTKSFLLYGSDKKAIGSIRSCTFGAKMASSVPTMQMYNDEISETVGYDGQITEINRFVIDPDFQTKGGIHARFSLFEHVISQAQESGSDCLLIAVRPEHVKFYLKLHYKPISEAKVYHQVKFKTVLMVATDISKTLEFIRSKLPGIKKNEPALNYSVN